MQPLSDNKEKDPQQEVLLAVYGEICKSYQAIDDFRTKLLGFLPLTSLIGIFLLDKEKTILSSDGAPNEMLGFAALFAALFTLALFGYEVRSILRSSHLIKEGVHIEQQLGVKHGHFYICAGSDCPDQRHPKNDVENIFNSKIVACVVYSVVFSAWMFMALRVGMRTNIFGCSISAFLTGLIIAFGAYQFIKKSYPA